MGKAVPPGFRRCVPSSHFPQDPLPACGGGWVLGGARPAAAGPGQRAAGRPDSRFSPAAATMRRKGTKPSTACHQEEGPPPSEDGALSEGEKEQPDCEVDSAAAAGE